MNIKPNIYLKNNLNLYQEEAFRNTSRLRL